MSIYIPTYAKSLRGLIWACESILTHKWYFNYLLYVKLCINSSWIISQCSEKWANFERKTACETIFRKKSENQINLQYNFFNMWIFCEFVKWITKNCCYCWFNAILLILASEFFWVRWVRLFLIWPKLFWQSDPKFFHFQTFDFFWRKVQFLLIWQR